MKKGLFAFLGSCALLFGGLIGIASSNVVATYAEEDSPYGNETLVDGNEFSISVSASALTETSQSFSCTLSSVKIDAWNNSTRYNNVFSRIIDDRFVSLDQAKADAQTAKEEAENSGTEFVPVDYEARVYNISNSAKSSSTIVLPQYINYGGSDPLFRLHVTGIESNACYDETASKVSYENISTIIIPDGYTNIAENALLDAKEANVTIKTTYSSAPEGWLEGWTDADVEYGYEITSSAETKMLDVNTTKSTQFGQGKDFIVGYYDESNHDNDLPLVVTYNTLSNDDNSLAGKGWSYYCDLNSTNRNYDAVGSNLGSSVLSLDLDLSIASGTHVDPESLVFHNIYEAKITESESGARIVAPNLEKGGFYAVPKLAYSNARYLSDFLSYDFGKVTTFGDYTMFSIKVKTNTGVFQMVNPSSYRNHKDEIAANTLRVRILLSSLAKANYEVAYYDRDGIQQTKEVAFGTPVSNSEIKDGEELGFLLKNSDVSSDFSYGKIIYVKIVGLSIKVDLYNDTKNSITNSSSVITRFAYIDLLSSTQKESTTPISIGAFLGISYGVYTVLFVAGSVGYYFYAKKKYRNDEFKRVDTKRFVKKALRNMLGYALILSAILFIVARWGLFDNIVVVYNPLDVWVIVFAICGAIFLGLAIRDLVLFVKHTNENKKKAKLHLDQDVVEDGTK